MSYQQLYLRSHNHIQSTGLLSKHIGICETTFKKRYGNHLNSINHEKYEKNTELSKEVWKLKIQNQIPKITWKIRKKCKPFNSTSGKCDLCLNEKLFILEMSDEIDLINKRDELVSKCRHQNKFNLCYKSGAKTWRHFKNSNRRHYIVICKVFLLISWWIREEKT